MGGEKDEGVDGSRPVEEWRVKESDCVERKTEDPEGHLFGCILQVTQNSSRAAGRLRTRREPPAAAVMAARRDGDRDGDREPRRRPAGDDASDRREAGVSRLPCEDGPDERCPGRFLRHERGKPRRYTDDKQRVVGEYKDDAEGATAVAESAGPTCVSRRCVPPGPRLVGCVNSHRYPEWTAEPTPVSCLLNVLRQSLFAEQFRTLRPRPVFLLPR